MDLGATWVWDSERAVHSLLDQLGVATFRIQASGLDTYDDGYVQPPDDQRLFGHAVLRRPWLDGRLDLVSCETSGVSPGQLDGAIEGAQVVARSLWTPLHQWPGPGSRANMPNSMEPRGAS